MIHYATHFIKGKMPSNSAKWQRLNA